MIGQEPTVLFLGNGRCYHTLDWFRSAESLRPDAPPALITDLIESESFVRLLKPEDKVERLFILDPFLFRKQSRMGDAWRNLLKFAVLPLQALRLKRVLKRYAGPVVVHAHSTYYGVLARLAGCRYVLTPQGSELLVRPFRSTFYKWFAGLGLSRAAVITVDSEAMRGVALRLYERNARIVQNGIDLAALSKLADSGERRALVSVRGFSENYQIHLLLQARNREAAGVPIDFCYPFVEMDYKSSWEHELIPGDRDIGRLPRLELYRLLASARLVVSIPVSDSSPRSVYEAIFCGAIVAVTPGPWISALPACMAARLIIVDPASEGWLAEAWARAGELVRKPYVPSSEALDLFDQRRSMQRFYEEIYPVAAQA